MNAICVEALVKFRGVKAASSAGPAMYAVEFRRQVVIPGLNRAPLVDLSPLDPARIGGSRSGRF